MPSFNTNRPAPDAPFSEETIWKEYMGYLADKYFNGLLLPDFPSDPPNPGGQYRIYFNTTTHKPVYYNGTAWVSL